MSLKKRIKNLWKLSGLELNPYENYLVKPDFTVAPINNKVQIINRKEVVDKFLEENFKDGK